MPRKTPQSQRTVEALHHFACGACRKWWSVSDAPKAKKIWHCPWCGERNEIPVIDLTKFGGKPRYD